MSSLQQNWRKRAGNQGGWGEIEGARGRNDPKNVCTYEYMNKEKIKNKEVHMNKIYLKQFSTSLAIKEM
jgi:hypothetical protein